MGEADHRLRMANPITVVIIIPFDCKQHNSRKAQMTKHKAPVEIRALYALNI